MWTRLLIITLAMISQAPAADLHKFQSWSTVCRSSPWSVAWGETLLEVEEAPGGAVVRFVYAGLRDVACGGNTVVAWEKRISKSPQALAFPIKMCQVVPDLNRLVKHHPYNPLANGIESDGIAFVIQCGAHRAVTGLPPPLGFSDLQEGSADDTYLGRLWDLYDKVMTAAWGEHPPDASVIDSAAERDGAIFAASARMKGYYKDDPFDLLDRFLSSYKVPVGTPVYD
jgi:hypothetical protein